MIVRLEVKKAPCFCCEATALLPVPPALDFGRIASLVAEVGEAVASWKEAVAQALSQEVTEDLPSILSVLRAVLRQGCVSVCLGTELAVSSWEPL